MAHAIVEMAVHYFNGLYIEITVIEARAQSGSAARSIVAHSSNFTYAQLRMNVFISYSSCRFTFYFFSRFFFIPTVTFSSSCKQSGFGFFVVVFLSLDVSAGTNCISSVRPNRLSQMIIIKFRQHAHLKSMRGHFVN